MDRIAALEAWYRRVYIDGDYEATDDLFAPDMHEEGLMPGMEIAPEDIRIFAMALTSLVDEPRFSIVKSVESGDWLAALIECRAVNPTTGRTVRAIGQLMARYEGERIAEAYNSFDFLGFFEQMGLLPQHSLALGMTGQKIA